MDAKRSGKMKKEERGVKESAPNAEKLTRMQAYLQEAAAVIHYLHWRVVVMRDGEYKPDHGSFEIQADCDGEFTEALVVEYLEAIAKQARAGFCRGPNFPVFGSLSR